MLPVHGINRRQGGYPSTDRASSLPTGAGFSPPKVCTELAMAERVDAEWFLCAIVMMCELRERKLWERSVVTTALRLGLLLQSAVRLHTAVKLALRITHEHHSS